MRATIKDVASASGVSIKTVSRVLNNERYVGGGTRKRVEAAVAELIFVPICRTVARRAAVVSYLSGLRQSQSFLRLCDAVGHP